ncbi:MAG TPA: malto-oligosyltrehalose trehalohydrolase [Polyangiaceae bacterium]|nr:malto-oligosyltrehalose trehalohydrolase [Polyangiaceae bacterium]
MNRRRYPVGAELVGGRVHVRVWAPKRSNIEVVAGGPDGRASTLSAEGNGYFSGVAEHLRAGSAYGFRLDGSDRIYPDPASRYQPDGPHGPSQVVDPKSFGWTDATWRGVPDSGRVVYELHLGTFTAAGTLESARAELPELAALGINVIELMPLADFTGAFGWGYDGVCLFAPCRLYGRPDELRAFVDSAHALGVAVILDVVYNHFGPAGNYLAEFSDHYFTDRYTNEWGDAINFDGEASAPVREFFISNARYWIDEFHFDGLRLDATQSIGDSSSTHVIAEIAEAVRQAAGTRRTYLVAENEPQHARLARSPEQGGFGLDALWNDDFHHTAMVALTGHNPAYYSDHQGTPQELISALRWGYLFQGQRYEWQKKARGSPALDLQAKHFVTYIQNHDQIANSARGQRLHELTSPGRLRAVTALMLLAPPTPMLFQGQEFAASAPFLFFADQESELARVVRTGRADFLKQFPAIASSADLDLLADPGARSTFEVCKLDFRERTTHAPAYRLHQDLLRLRREDPAFAQERSDALYGAVLGPEALLLRISCPTGDRLLLMNLGRDLQLSPAPEPLLAPPDERGWHLLWSSEDPLYGGHGTPVPEPGLNWSVPGHALLVLAPAGDDT